MNVPHRFTDLVEILETADPKPSVVESDEELWSHFCWTVLLGGNRTEAEVNYAYHLLYEYGLMDRDVLEDGWVECSKKCLKKAEDEAEEPNINGKIVAIHKIELELENIYVTLSNADTVFENMEVEVDAEYLQEIAGEHEEEKNLLAEIASQDEVSAIRKKPSSKHPNKIWGIAYTKALLWLKACGVALDFIPNNNHSMKFLKECDKNWTKKDFFIVNNNFNVFCDNIDADPYYAGLALWYYEATKSLVSRKNSQYYSPGKLIRIMENNDLDIYDIATYLGDIEHLEELKELLNSDS